MIKTNINKATNGIFVMSKNDELVKKQLHNICKDKKEINIFDQSSIILNNVAKMASYHNMSIKKYLNKLGYKSI